MATNTNIFIDKETNNWFKACIALNVTKEGLTNFVETEIKHVHNSIGRSCGNCCTQNLVGCPTKGICKKSRNCNYHTQTKQPRQCPVKLCELVAKNVTSLHRYNGPSWFNTKAELWSTDQWQIAKCFFPPDGYINVSSIHDTDFNGVLSVLLNCKHFDSCISFTIAPKPPAPECLLTKARQIGRAIRHTTNCKVTDAELHDFLQTLDTLLADPKCLANEPTATAARTKLLNLQKDRLSLTELGELLKEANQTVIKAKETGERFSENAERTLTVGLQTLEAAILAGEIRLESKAQDMIVRIQQAANEKEKEDYERAVADLLSRLVEYYRDTVSYVPLSTLNHSLDKHVQDVYVTPKIHRINIENDGRRTKQEQILTYRDCFCRSDHLSRRTYLQGEPGSGKTSFAAKLVYDWCNVHGPSTESEKEQTTFGDVDILHNFKFLFFISLRDSRNHTYVTHMIKTQLIYKIYAEDEWERAYKLVLKIMKNVMYLVVQDGLDEWPCEHAVPSMDGIPKDHCLVLTTSRPWKLADERIKNSQIDILLEVEGISDPEEFNEKLLRCLLDETKDLKETVKQFQTFLKGRGLESISSSPMLYTLVLCTYVDHMAESLTGSSMCELYTTMLENLCKKANTQISYFDQYHLSPVKAFACTKYIRPNIDHIDSISKAAFSFLFSNKKESSLVFSDIDLSAHLSETAKQFALDSGILSKRKGKRCTDQTLSFVHKTIQEFLTAFHINRNADVIDDVLSGYLKRHNNAYRDISQMFIFRCGFNISAANKLSSMMNELNVYGVYGHYFQDCIISGYREAVANKNSPIHLHLSHFDFDSDNAEDLIQIWTLNTSHARFLKVHLAWRRFSNIYVTIRSQDASSADCHGPGSVSLHARQDPDVANRDDREEIRSSTSCIEFDLSSCHNLERLVLIGTHVTVLSNALMGLKKLEHLTIERCKCEAIDLSHCVHINSIRIIGSSLLCNCKELDLSSCNNLKLLELENYECFQMH
ncbi:uncharacterized protein LOC127856046 [Dreissena polymorpha]|uniref:NACHT domain-containing protein n=1 Tax=Dreissena polymorpha TaxID=45954 RepID=A0A9D4HH34_DREPO|nr:uncharacterized protein LOC127856046 [Dreissena polymorpha]KAH3717214.1 hypothetical protein DPMN_059995 [Dreissena polymorpha]